MELFLVPPTSCPDSTLPQPSDPPRSPWWTLCHLSHHGDQPKSPLPRSWPGQVSRFCQEMTKGKNYALPNASWGPDMLSLYHEFLEKTKTSGWVRVPSFRSNRDHIQGFKLPLDLSANSDKSDWRLFTRCIEREGQGYEYVIFFQPSEKKSICLFQPGPYLEGVPGFVHGGSLAALIDETFSKTAYLSGEGLLTVNFNIRFKNLIPLGSLAVLNVNVEKIEDQKMYLSCVTQSRDQQTVYAKASGTFLQMHLEKDSSRQ
uniref:Thioesterase superfamily member 5 n=1 Tax=Bos mutus grunniens TaxID=30521 RepID=A0A8B9WG61_BOSMU